MPRRICPQNAVISFFLARMLRRLYGPLWVPLGPGEALKPSDRGDGELLLLSSYPPTTADVLLGRPGETQTNP